jgi:hypothetical protein
VVTSEEKTIDQDKATGCTEQVEYDSAPVPVAAKRMHHPMYGHEEEGGQGPFVGIVGDREVTGPELLGGYDQLGIEIRFHADIADGEERQMDSQGGGSVNESIEEWEHEVERPPVLRSWRR